MTVPNFKRERFKNFYDPRKIFKLINARFALINGKWFIVPLNRRRKQSRKLIKRRRVLK